MDVITTEDGAGWLAFLRSLVARGPSRVQMVISDAHEGLQAAIESYGRRVTPWRPRAPHRAGRKTPR